MFCESLLIHSVGFLSVSYLQVLLVLLPLVLGDSDGDSEGVADESDEDHPLAHGVALGSIGSLGGL